MYIVIMLKNGQRKEYGRYDSPADFRYDYPAVEYITVGFVIYIHEELD